MDGYAFEMLCEVIQQGNFENNQTPLQLFDKAVNIFTEQHETPLKAVQDFESLTDKANLTLAQKLFVYEWICKYLKVSDFGEIDTKELKYLLKSYTEKLKAEKPKSQKLNTTNH